MERPGFTLVVASTNSHHIVPHWNGCRPALYNQTEDARLVTVRAPAPYRPLCLELALGTRVCGVRVDAVKDLREVVSVGGCMQQGVDEWCSVCLRAGCAGGCSERPAGRRW